MLRELHISGLGVIEDLNLELHEGLNVLTGETGAGKTMVTVGLSLALGSRATASLVRPSSSAANVQARFDAPAWAEEWAEEGEVILARRIGADGRGTARIGGQMTTVSALASLAADLVEVHGQHQTQRLLSSATQTAFLDRFAGDAHMVALATYREAFDELKGASAELEELTGAVRDRERELDLLAYQVREIGSVDPRPGESASLAVEELRLGHVERILERVSSAIAGITEEDGIADALGSAAAALAEAALLDPDAAEPSGRATAIVADVSELARDLRSYSERLQVDPLRLQEVRERIQALRGLQRKYGETDEEVLAFFEGASARIEDLTGFDDRRTHLEQKVAELQSRAMERAAMVGDGREGAAVELAAAIEAELHELGMEGAGVRVDLETLPELTASGSERVELLLAGGPGQDPTPLGKTASGGELSRTMLACRSVLADLDAVGTLVFDEIDAGIGGRAGLAVGRRLARLAADRQVLVVTHLPQIASFADRHIRLEKLDGRATALVLTDGERIEELARMLAGLPGSEGAASHAEELLAEARTAR